MSNSRNKACPHWGLPGAPLLPESLRRAWSQVAIPQWVAIELGLPQMATHSALDAEVGVAPGASLERVQHYLGEMLRVRLPELRHVLAFGRAWPAELDASVIPWRNRTRNRLINAGLIRRLDGIANVTFGELERVPQMGVVAILDFLTTIEAAELHFGARLFPKRSTDADSSVAPSEFEVPGTDDLVRALDEDWIDRVSLADPRFADLLPPISGTLFEAIDEITSGASAAAQSVEAIEAVAAAIPAIRARAERIRALPIEQALAELLVELLGNQDIRVTALIARFQWGGQEKPYTLEAAGRLAGISRERVRQLEKRIKERLTKHSFYLPQLDQGMQLLAERAPIEAAEGARILLENGISEASFHPRSLLAVATLFRCTPLVQIERRMGRDAVVREVVSSAADSILATTYRQLSQVGTTNLGEVASDLHAAGVQVSEEEIAQVLKLYAGVTFTSDTWFWCRTRPHSNLVTQAKKMLSVVSPIDIASLREGMKRAMRFRRISGRGRHSLVVPTKQALFEYLRGHPDFIVSDSGSVKYALPLDCRDVLPTSERVLWQALAESPSGILDRSHFHETCVSRGLNRHTFSILTTYSPILEPLGFGLWSLRGRHVDPAVLEVHRQLSSERPRERRGVNHGWSEDGRLWVAIRLPDDPSSVLPHIPAAARRYLTSDEYRAVTASGADCGRVKIYQTGGSFGYAPFLRQAGADEGDILLAEFDLPTASVTLSLGEDALLDQFDGGG